MIKDVFGAGARINISIKLFFPIGPLPHTANAGKINREDTWEPTDEAGEQTRSREETEMERKGKCRNKKSKHRHRHRSISVLRASLSLSFSLALKDKEMEKRPCMCNVAGHAFMLRQLASDLQCYYKKTPTHPNTHARAVRMLFSSMTRRHKVAIVPALLVTYYPETLTLVVSSWILTSRQPHRHL